MIELNFSNKYNHKINLIDNKKYIFDPLRKKNILLTNEEWVRQNIVSFLIHELNVPLSHIAIERGLTFNKLRKRFDVVVFDKHGKVNILIECKSPNVKLNQKSIDQLVIYNMELKSKFLMLSNGLKHIFLKFNNNKFKIINSIPKYSDL
ncbi:MAG: restriction endonuclease subunit R [Flavobacteriales bacterium]|nr:restriction endonuclease subunit R [Flavobacteriales bacterium]